MCEKYVGHISLCDIQSCLAGMVTRHIDQGDTYAKVMLTSIKKLRLVGLTFFIALSAFCVRIIIGKEKEKQLLCVILRKRITCSHVASKCPDAF